MGLKRDYRWVSLVWLGNPRLYVMCNSSITKLYINCTVSKGRGKSPLELLLLLGKYVPHLPLTYCKLTMSNRQTPWTKLDSLLKSGWTSGPLVINHVLIKIKPQSTLFEVDDFVLMRRYESHTTKLGSKFEGSMEILQVLYFLLLLLYVTRKSIPA